MILPNTPRFASSGPTPGVYENVPAGEYFRWPYASKSLLKEIVDCPTDAHIWAVLNASQGMTNALADGAAYDAMLLEPETFATRYAVVPKMTRKGKEWDAIAGRVGGAEYVIWEEDDADNPTRLDFKTLTAMHTALRSQARTRACLKAGNKAQVSLVWDDADTGIRCKARLDRVLPNDVIVDLKTAESAERVEFGRAAFNFGYDIQAAMYCDGYAAHFGVQPTFLFLVQEKAPPYASAIYDATDEREQPTAAECGRVRYRANLARLKEAIGKGTWLGYGDEPMPLCLPEWAVPAELSVRA